VGKHLTAQAAAYKAETDTTPAAEQPSEESSDARTGGRIDQSTMPRVIAWPFDNCSRRVAVSVRIGVAAGVICLSIAPVRGPSARRSVPMMGGPATANRAGLSGRRRREWDRQCHDRRHYC
jgi:hypothetical protein